jgi:tetratricopeptide (TPR) repeat protein
MARFDAGRASVAALLTALAVVVAGYGAYRWYSGRTPPIGPSEPLLLADFVNTTGEAVFDGALKDALEIQLRQSPYLNVLPSEQVRGALSIAGKAADEEITPALARDLCQRLGATAILLGSIAPLDGAYTIGLDAQECASGETLIQEYAQAASKTDVLDAVGVAATRLRKRLGEPPASIERFNVPAHIAATASLDALKAYSVGLETRAGGGDAEAIAAFRQALELDPDFALAAATLGSIYADQADVQQAQFYMKQAYAASEPLSEPARLFIKASYNEIVTGRLDDVISTHEVWAQTYAQDWVPHNRLSASYYRANRLEEALTEAQAAVKLGPRQVAPYEQLARTLIAMDRADEAGVVLREAHEKGLDSSSSRALLYRLAFHEGDTASMQEHFQAANSRADGYLIVAEAARAAAASGAFEASRTTYLRAVELANAANLTDYAGRLMAELGTTEALIGHRDAGRRDMFAAVDLSNGPGTMWMASLAASFTGMTSEAIQLAIGYAQGVPPAPDVVATLRPILEAGVALAQDDAATALEALSRADPFARASDPWVPYLRGLAYLAQENHTQAAAQFRAALTGRTHQPITILHPLSRLHLARSLRASGDLPAAREAYAELTAAWKNADAEHELVVAASREAAATTQDGSR